MTTFVRVTDNATGHQYDLPESAIDDQIHTRLNDEAYPDLSGPTAQARPQVYAEPKKSTPKSGAASADKNKES